MTAAPGWTVREATKDDFDRIRLLYREVWGYSRPAAFDRWRYLAPPDGFCPIAIADAGDLLAGAYIIWPVRLRVGRRVILGAQSMDTMTHPNYQGQGVFTKLAEACFGYAAARGFELIYGFPNPLSYPGFVRRLGFAHIGDVWHWIRPICPSTHPRMPSVAGTIADALMGLWPDGKITGVELGNDIPSAECLSQFYGRLNGTADCRVDRTPAWLLWRYATQAENNYRWVTAYRHGQLVGVGVWGARNVAWGSLVDKRAHLVELFGDVTAMRAVLAEIIGEARRAGHLLLETLCSFPEASSVLRRAGFIRHRKAPLIVKNLAGGPFELDIHDSQHWKLIGGDVDTF